MSGVSTSDFMAPGSNESTQEQHQSWRPAAKRCICFPFDPREVGRGARPNCVIQIQIWLRNKSWVLLALHAGGEPLQSGSQTWWDARICFLGIDVMGLFYFRWKLLRHNEINSHLSGHSTLFSLNLSGDKYLPVLFILSVLWPKSSPLVWSDLISDPICLILRHALFQLQYHLGVDIFLFLSFPYTLFHHFYGL